MEHNIEQAKNMKLLLSAFEQLSGLKINFHKNEIFCFGQTKDYESQYEQLFGCKKRIIPFQIFRNSYASQKVEQQRLGND
jgi:hypothetical protein